MSIKYARMLTSTKKDRKLLSAREITQCRCTKKEKRTKQSESAACDINNIVKRYIATGLLPDHIKTNPKFGDFSTSVDYQTSLNTIIKAREQFELLPSKLRSKLNNDPSKFLEFVADPKNEEELIKMRLAQPKIEQGNEIASSSIAKLAESISGALASPDGTKATPKKSQASQGTSE